MPKPTRNVTEFSIVMRMTLATLCQQDELESYSECYDLDINSVAFELQTDCISTRLYSETIKPAITHLVSFTMESREKRISMFDVGDNSFEIRNLNFSVQ